MDTNKIPMRGRLSPKFLETLQHGAFSNVLRVARHDKDLDIQLRDNYLDIYYQGGKLLQIKPMSFQFDKFYFYFGKYPSTFVKEMLKKGKRRISERTKNPIPSEKTALSIVKHLDSKKNDLLSFLPSYPEEFFSIAKKSMDKWFKKNNKNERHDQHYISLANNVENVGDLTVIDIEYAVSRQVQWHHPNNKPCRFDIVAVDRAGHLYVIELKENMAADSGSSSSNVSGHLEDFRKTIGADAKKEFTQEMRTLLHTKQQLKLVSDDVQIASSQIPSFAVAYSGKEEKEKAKFKEKYKKAGIQVLEIDDSNRLCFI